MKVTLFLMTLKGVEVLNAIAYNSYLDIIDKVIIGRDNNVLNDYSNDIEQICLDNGISYSFSSEDYNINTQYGIAISWRWIINHLGLKLIVLHDSILPKYRGFAPLVNMLINGEKKIGVTALFACSEFDKGPIVLQKDITINYPIKIEKAIRGVSVLYVEIVNELLYNISRELPIQGVKQDETNASYSLWRDKEDYFINWGLPASKICKFVDAVGYPYEGAKCKINNAVVKIIDVDNFEDLEIENRDIGKVLFFEDELPIIVCGSGLIKIKKAVYETTGESIFPIKKFRTRFE
jgi:methionyl-tRNA formyltransferase